MPTFSIPVPKELGMTTGWSIFLYRALLRCEEAVKRPASLGDGVAVPWERTGATTDVWSADSDLGTGNCGAGSGVSSSGGSGSVSCCDKVKCDSDGSGLGSGCDVEDWGSSSHVGGCAVVGSSQV